ncbi:hypothetical protein N657DRAFT_317688 [Parathielavia appendiculata]|uniref:Uncharacterized protein n=1 Tax=Parathielavia appendiculata TaxID=2587402 RepID=A0AAN6TRP1_9PEZI|nr:hypothetical protein N657DRAFT_317688 [Parathielavia appendiculata]
MSSSATNCFGRTPAGSLTAYATQDLAGGQSRSTGLCLPWHWYRGDRRTERNSVIKIDGITSRSPGNLVLPLRFLPLSVVHFPHRWQTSLLAPRSLVQVLVHTLWNACRRRWNLEHPRSPALSESWDSPGVTASHRFWLTRGRLSGRIFSTCLCSQWYPCFVRSTPLISFAKHSGGRWYEYFGLLASLVLSTRTEVAGMVLQDRRRTRGTFPTSRHSPPPPSPAPKSCRLQPPTPTTPQLPHQQPLTSIPRPQAASPNHVFHPQSTAPNPTTSAVDHAIDTGFRETDRLIAQFHEEIRLSRPATPSSSSSQTQPQPQQRLLSSCS